MKFNYSLDTNTLVKSDKREAITLPENELIISFSSDVYVISNLIVTARNGKREIQRKLNKDFSMDISSLLKEGEIDIEVSHLCGGNVVKGWRCEKIIVKRIKHHFEAVPEIENLKLEINTVKKGLAELYSLVK